MPWTYIVECADGSYYVGSTVDLERRIWEHNNDPAGAAYTRRRRPVRLVWCADYASIAEAFAFEKRVQGWSRRKREALIRGDFARLPALSARRTSSTDRFPPGGFETGASAPSSTTDPPGAGAPSSTTDPPGAGAAPSTTDPPGAGAAPSTTDPPGAGAAPSTTEPPGAGAAPSTTDPPGAGAPPSTTDPPGASAPPSTTDPPGASAAPSTTAAGNG